MKANKLKIGIVQRSHDDEIELNRNRNRTLVESLAADGANLIVLSELHDSPYFCQAEDVENFKYATLLDEFIDFYADIARKNNVVLVTSTFEKRAPGLYHNTVYQKTEKLSEEMGIGPRWMVLPE